ncbi:MAG: diguanylate cyclase [Candidatus Gastranaerophilales bacterium]|nr:diguanylate cyclase [Candidatus Gastranaerophilales bacterium]
MNISKIKDFIKNNKILFKYSFLIVFVLLILSIVMLKSSFGNFLKAMELKTFDIRQSIIADKKTVSDDIRIITVDDESYEYVINKYGEWPIPRHVYAQILDYVEAQNPSVVGFDLLFVHSMRNNKNSDDRLGQAFAKYDNAFTAINFDDTNFAVRKPPVLPEAISYMPQNVPVEKNTEFLIYKNCRAIIPQILNNTKNVGHINTSKDDDGITRRITLTVGYPVYKIENDEYVPDSVRYYDYMTYKMFLKYTNQNHGNYNTFSPVMLNWYGETGLEDSRKFKYIPMWKVIDSMENGKDKLPDDTFTNKVVFLGTSVFSLSDIKSVPTSKYMPGVEVHATLFNNLLDNSFIKPASPAVNVLISLVLAGIIAFVCFYCSSVAVASVVSVVLLAVYLVFSTLIMQFANVWVWTVLPVLSAVLAIIAVYVTKYILKSRDFELTYKLATTDGLTDLYNHRFFQEQMKLCIDDCRRYNRNFSLIMIDIDFFKKFNDTYGHQAGDAVLRGVAHTLKRNVRSSDIVCRYGGEEMAIILKDTAFEEAKLIANKICKTIAAKPFKIAANTEKQVTISLGVSTYPMCGLETQEMIEFADKGLYAAKENGRNQVGQVDLPQ